MSIDKERRDEIQKILESPEFRSQSVPMFKASVKAKAEVRVLRVQKRDDVYYVYSVGYASTGSSVSFSKADTSSGQVIFDLHPHPHESLYRKVPSNYATLKDGVLTPGGDLVRSADAGYPGVVMYGENGYTIYQGAY